MLNYTRHQLLALSPLSTDDGGKIKNIRGIEPKIGLLKDLTPVQWLSKRRKDEVEVMIKCIDLCSECTKRFFFVTCEKIWQALNSQS